MRVLIIYMSFHHGNTQRLAGEIGKVLNATVKNVADVKPEELAKYDLVGFGSGIYMLRHHKAIMEFVNLFPDSRELRQKAFVFSTSGSGMILFHRQLKARLYAKGFEVVGEFACKGWDTYSVLDIVGGINKNRPNEADFSRARIFAESLRNL